MRAVVSKIGNNRIARGKAVYRLACKANTRLRRGTVLYGRGRYRRAQILHCSYNMRITLQAVGFFLFEFDFLGASIRVYSLLFYYFADFAPQPSQGAPQQSLLHQAGSMHASPNQMPQIAPPPLAPIPQQGVPVSTAAILQAPPQFGAAFPQAPPPFLQPAVAPPAFIAQQTPQLINYVQSQPQYPQAPFQGFQQTYNPVVSEHFYGCLKI